MSRAYALLVSHKKVISPMEEVNLVRSGLPVAALDRISEEAGFSQEALCKLLGLSQRTMSRRKEKSAKLKPEESDKLLRLAHIITLARRVLEDNKQAIAWLSTPKVALENQTPMSLMDTEIGAREVEKLLFRIEHGVYT